jgi:hypothetical protein
MIFEPKSNFIKRDFVDFKIENAESVLTSKKSSDNVLDKNRTQEIEVKIDVVFICFTRRKCRLEVGNPLRDQNLFGNEICPDL